MSSAVYAWNDAFDVENDRSSPDKKDRPIACGDLTVKTGITLSCVLGALSLLLSSLVSVRLIIFIGSYGLLNLFYTQYLKKKVILDVFCIALGFILRMLAGTVALGIQPSHWIIICTMMISLFLGFGKRYAELSAREFKARGVLAEYQKDFLLLLLGISTACTILSYGLYTISERTIRVHGTDHLIYSVPIVIYGLFRYLYLILSQGLGRNPAYLVLTDRSIQGTLFVYALFIFFVESSLNKVSFDTPPL